MSVCRPARGLGLNACSPLPANVAPRVRIDESTTSTQPGMRPPRQGCRSLCRASTSGALRSSHAPHICQLASHSGLGFSWRRSSFSSDRVVIRGNTTDGSSGARRRLTVTEAAAGKDSKPRRVVVTGLGVVSCLGDEVEAFYNNLLAGKSGVTLIESFDTTDYPTRFGGEIKNLNTDGLVSKKLDRRLDKFMKYLLVAGKKAMRDAKMFEKVELDALNKARVGVLIGSSMGGMQIFSDAVNALITEGHKKMNPFCIPFAVTNMGSAILAMEYGFMGPNYSIATACATGNYCILNAAQHIRRGEADIMLAGGSDAAILPEGIGGFCACKALSKRNDEPHRASRPWDKDRDGFVMGEGAGVLVLEDYEHAKARGAHIYCEFLGGGYACDGYHMTEPLPNGAGVKLCLETALRNAGVKREDVTYVNAHATSTPAGDMAEYGAIMQVFGNNPVLKLNATKSMTGHLLGAAGAIEAVVSVMALKTGMLHPSINLDNPEDAVDLRKIVGKTAEPQEVKVALSNSFGFGGHNSAILFSKLRE